MPSNVPDWLATPEPASVADQVIVEKSSVSKIDPSGGELIVMSGGVVSRKTSVVSGEPAGSESLGRERVARIGGADLHLVEAVRRR